MELIHKYFPSLTDKQAEQFAALQSLYEEWNAQINVVSRKDIDELYLRHVLHSLAIAKYTTFKPGASVLDFGTGGGFPGIPLAIMFPETGFTLVDSIGKKIKVVRAVRDALELKNVCAQAERVENIKGDFDFAVCRAVTRLGNIMPWMAGKIKDENVHACPNGLLCLKGGDLDTEIAEINNPVDVTDLTDYFDDPFFETKKLVHVAI